MTLPERFFIRLVCLEPFAMACYQACIEKERSLIRIETFEVKRPLELVGGILARPEQGTRSKESPTNRIGRPSR